MRLTVQQRAEQRRLAQAIARVGFVLPGTLLERYLPCQNAGCRCHDDPPQLHGPYWYWTRKIDSKTVSRTLSADQVDDYRAWFENRHELRDLIHELEALSIAIIDADPRSPSRRRPIAQPVDKPRSPHR